MLYCNFFFFWEFWSIAHISGAGAGAGAGAVSSVRVGLGFKFSWRFGFYFLCYWPHFYWKRCFRWHFHRSSCTDILMSLKLCGCPGVRMFRWSRGPRGTALSISGCLWAVIWRGKGWNLVRSMSLCILPREVRRCSSETILIGELFGFCLESGIKQGENGIDFESSVFLCYILVRIVFDWIKLHLKGKNIFLRRVTPLTYKVGFSFWS